MACQPLQKRSPCANRGRSKGVGDYPDLPTVSLCEQGSKEDQDRVFAAAMGLPVRTGVEGKAKEADIGQFGSPCANRGRRMTLTRMIGL